MVRHRYIYFINASITICSGNRRATRFKIGAIEEAAYRMGFIDKKPIKKIITPLIKSGYGKNLSSLI